VALAEGSDGWTKTSGARKEQGTLSFGSTLKFN